MQTLLAIVLILLLVALTDPFMYWMPPAAAMTTLVVAAGIVAAFAGIVLKENGGDERDASHRSFAGRFGYLAGLAILTTALLVQGFTHTLDPWIPLALGAMVIGKIVARLYAGKYH